MTGRTLKANILLTLTALIWGCAFVAQRVGMDYVGPFTFNGIRFALGALALVPLIRRMDRQRRGKNLLEREAGAPTLKTYLWGGALAGLALFSGATLQQVGIIYTTAGNAGFITGLYVILVPVMGLFFRRRPGFGTWIGAILATIGLYLLSVSDSFTMELGDFLVLLSAIFWAGHVLLIGWLAPKMDPLKLSSVQFAACSVLSLITAVFTETLTMEGLAGAAVPILYGGLMSVGVAYTLQVVAQRDAEPAHAAIILSLEGLFAALAGWVLLGEVMSLRGMIGCALMLAGMLYSQLKP